MSREQRQRIDGMLRQGSSEFSNQSVEDMRASFAALMDNFAVPEVNTEATTLGGRPAVRVTPVDGAEATPVIMYFHGGSFSLGSPETAMGLTASLVTRTGFSAVSLDYRLAPEHPFPAGIEDCVAAYKELLDSGVSAASVAFAGDSAGGGLSVTATMMARDAGLPVPGAIAVFSPGLDHTRSGGSMTTKEGVDPLFTRESMAHTGGIYLGDQDPNQPLAAPAVLGDLTGFPPIMLQVGTNELMLDDSVRLAKRAIDAEVDVVLDVTAAVPHVFQSFIGQLDEAGEALERAAVFLKQKLK